MVLQTALSALRGGSGLPALDAREDFRRARRAYRAARLASWLTGARRRPTAPRSLTCGVTSPGIGTRVAVIPLSAIAGTVEPTTGFDARFRPASEHVRARWERIALAHRTGRSLPPIVVARRDDAYYVIDGRHRVSVALALGLRDIDAFVGSVASITRAADARQDGAHCARLAA